MSITPGIPTNFNANSPVQEVTANTNNWSNISDK